MLTAKERQLYSLAIVFLSLVAGIAFLTFPASAEDNEPEYSANVFVNELNAMVGYAPPGHFTTARVTAGNDIAVTITVLLATSSTVIFSGNFQAGTFEVSRTSLGSGGNVFLSIESKSGAFTQINVYVRIFHYFTTYPYSWLGLAAVGFGGLFALATFFKNTAFGKVAGKILPVGKLGL